MHLALKIIVCTAFFLSNAGVAIANTFDFREETITGYTPVTAQLAESTYRNRALENALNQLIISNTQKIKSFSLVEDGKLLIDQIQSQTNVRIFEYQILDQRKNGSKYEIDVKFLYAYVDQDIVSDPCRSIPTKGLETFISLNSYKNSVLPWVTLRLDTISEAISRLDHQPSMQLISRATVSKKQNNLYRLNRSKTSSNVYEMQANINYSPSINRTILGKKSVIGITVDIKTSRNGSDILSHDYVGEFIADHKTINNISLTKSRRNWKETEDEIYTFIVESVENHIRKLDCVEISPELNVNNNEVSLNIGSAEGIKSDDLIIAKDISGREIFLKIEQLKTHTATLSFISKMKNITSFRPRNVSILSGV